jgi:hypothetical protein
MMMSRYLRSRLAAIRCAHRKRAQPRQYATASTRTAPRDYRLRDLSQQCFCRQS